MRRRRRSCRRYADQLTRAMDSGVVDLGLRRHVRACAACRRELQQYRRLDRVLHSLPGRVPIPATAFLAAKRKRIRRLAASGAAGGLGLAGLFIALSVSARRRHP